MEFKHAESHKVSNALYDTITLSSDVLYAFIVIWDANGLWVAS